MVSNTRMNAEEAALRELYEETTLVAEPLGVWKAARAYTGTMVTPVLGFVGDMSSHDIAQLPVQKDEVEYAFAISITDLLDVEKRVEEELESFRTTRFLAGPSPVWGLTGFFTEGILKTVIAPVFDRKFEAIPG